MIKVIAPVFILLSFSLAFEPAELVRPAHQGGLSKRTVNLGGGYSLNVQTCPPDTTACGLGGCFPSALQCVGLGT